jgi:etoposide-induced 2.4 mRNA
MATRARPTPTYPYNPIPNDGNVVRYPSPFVPVRLPIFAPVIWLNDSIVSLLSVGVRNVAGMSTVKVDVKSHGGSLDGMDSIEDGARGSSARGGVGMAPGRRRVNLGRKKLD